MCDVRLFRSAFMDFLTAKQIYETPYNDEMYLNNAAYHLQQAVEKTLKGALECAGITVPNTHKITKLIAMISHHEKSRRIIPLLFLIYRHPLIRPVRRFPPHSLWSSPRRR